MASIKDRLIQVILRGKDELSAEAAKGSEALDELRQTGEHLQSALGKTEGASKLARQLDDTRTTAERSQAAYVKAEADVARLRAELDAAPSSKGLQVSLREAERYARSTGRELDKLRAAERQLDEQARAAGIATADLAAEQQRLQAEVDAAKTAITANAQATDTLRSSAAEAARAAAELEQQQRQLAGVEGDALARHREAIASQQQLNGQTASYGERLRDTARSMATYVAGYLALDAALGAVRNGITAMLKAGDEAEQMSSRMASLMGSIEAGNQATEWIGEFAKSTPLAVGEVTEAFQLLKSYGLDPMDGSLQAIVDKNEQLGGGMERLTGIASALGQANAKGKLQTEEILQLVERGVPVWDMLAESTGKNVEQLQALASEGALGRDVIAKLIEEIGKSADGAAAAAMASMTGQLSNLQDTANSFLKDIAQSGALDHVKERLQALSDSVGEMAKDGRLKALAVEFSDAFVGLAKGAEAAGRGVVAGFQAVGSAISGATDWVGRHTTALAALATAFAAMKVNQAAAAMIAWATATSGATAAVTLLQAASIAMTAGLAKVGAAAVAAGVALKTAFGSLPGIVLSLGAAAVYAGKSLYDSFAPAAKTAKEMNAEIERTNALLQEQYQASKQVADSTKEVFDQQRKSVAEMRKLSESDRDIYKQKLEQLKEEQEQLAARAKAALEAGQITEAEEKRAQRELQSTTLHLEELAAAGKHAADALRGDMTTGALGLVETFTEMSRAGKSAEEILAAIGNGFDPRSEQQLKDVGLALQYLGQYGKLSGEQIQQFLSEKLKNLSSEDLLKVQTVAATVFADMGRGAKAAGQVVEASLNTALAKLGLDLEEINSGIGKSARETLTAFDDVIAQQLATGQSAEQSAKVIVAAYQSAREKIDDPDALKQLEGAYKAWTQTSAEAGQAAKARMTELQAETEDATKGIEGMEDALTRVGAAATAMELANIGVAASKAFHEGRMSAEQYANVQGEIKARYAELASAARETGQAGKEAAEQLTKSQQMYNAALEDGILTNEELRRISGQRMEEERRASGELMEMQRKGQVDVQRDMSAMNDWVSGVMESARQPLAAMSAAALEAYDNLRGLDSVSVGIDTSGLEATRASLNGVADQLEAVKAAQMELLSKGQQNGLSAWQLDVQRASLETQQAYLGQKASLQSLMDRYESGSMSLKSFISAAKGAASGMSLLDDSDLSSLESAIASAEQRMQALGDSTRNTLEGLQSELDQLRGNEEAVEARRFAQRRRELELQREEARAAGDDQAASNLTRALSVLREVQAETEQQRITKEQQARQQQQQAAVPAKPAPAQQPATVIRLETSRGARVDVSVPQGQQTQLLDILAEAGLRTT